MTAHHWFLALACLTLLLVIAAQDYLYAPLRNKTISAGLTGPYHALLDASYVPLAVSLGWAFWNGTEWQATLAFFAGTALLFVAATNTAWRFFDSITHGKHAMVHSDLTLIVFTSAIALQVVTDIHWHPGWWITALNVGLPGLAYAYFRYERTDIDGTVVSSSPAAEKLFVLGLCIWLIVWALR
ncbi:MAG: hypothetical protein KGL39_09550 [Patescibacteria group bacterium]|nr:hypothetical protein [Patescibacteria group bacterium]